MAKKMVRPKVKKAAGKKKGKKNLLTAVDENTSTLRSDEPGAREGSFSKELVNEGAMEEEEDAEEKTFYGEREEGI